MRNVITQSREIVCWLSDRRLIYSIPLYFQMERDYFRSHYLDGEIERSHKKDFHLRHGELKSYIIQPELAPLTNEEKYRSS